MKAPTVEHDERTVQVENASYAVGYKLVAYALLLDVMYRSLRLGDASWDLLGIVIVSGIVIAAYQTRFQILTNHTFKRIMIGVLLAAGIAVALAALLR